MMGVLQFEIATIPEEGIQLEERVSVAALQPEDVAPLTAKTLCLRGLLAPMGHGFLFRGELEATFQQPCDRCLATASETLVLDVLWNFEEGTTRQFFSDDEDDESLEENYSEFRSFTGGTLDIGEAVWEELVFNAPTKYTCEEDCKGLCPQCGMNLNAGDCACDINEPKEPEANRGLSGLAELFPDLAPGKQEE